MKQIIAILLVFFVTISCTKKFNKSNDTVVIVGAGISGLAAARELKEHGVTNVIVLEAQDKSGGRIKTDYSGVVPFDLGASWIHGKLNNPITSLAQKAGLQTFETVDDNAIAYDVDGSVYSEDIYDLMDAEYENMISTIERIGDEDKSFKEVFESNYSQLISDRFWKFMLSAYAEFDTGADISDLSSLYYYDDDAYKGNDDIIINGYDKLIDYLLQGLDVRYNQAVSKIDYAEDKIIVSTADNEYEANAVICAVPLGVLQKGMITFTPELPRKKQEALDQLQMGVVNKFLLEWDTAFWDIDKQYIAYTPEEKGKFNYFLNVKLYSDVNALMTFSFGDYSKTTENMTDEQVNNEIMGHLRVMYGDSIPNPVRMLRTKWNTNEYTYGSYSFVAVNGASDAYYDLADDIDKKVFFAGEHTSFEYRGTVHGAYQSGQVAAKSLLKKIK